MSNVPRRRYHNYGTYETYRVENTFDLNAGTWTPLTAPSVKSLGGHTDSLLVSVGHRAPYSSSPYNGGDFYKTASGQRINPGAFGSVVCTYGTVGGKVYAYRTTGAVSPVSVQAPIGGLMSYPAIRSIAVPMGTSGWNRFKPGKPIASVAQFIAELRQLPKNPFRLAAAVSKQLRSGGSRAYRADVLRRAVGDQYLNYSFGWRPFLSDLEKIADFDSNLIRHMAQLRRDNGRTVRRGGTIESDLTTTTSRSNSTSPQGYIDGPSVTSGSVVGPQGSYRESVTTTEWRCWFSAGFVYWLPREDDPMNMSRLRRYLAGGGISPSLVWELTPWSWLADYYSNIGDILDNWESSRELHLAAKYAYVMYHKKIKRVDTHRGWGARPSCSWDATASVDSWVEMKARTAAGAYDPGFTNSPLTDGQKANLLALGLSRRI